MSAFARYGSLIGRTSTLAVQKRLMVSVARTSPSDTIEKLFSSKIKTYKTSFAGYREWQQKSFDEEIEKLKKVDGLESASTHDLEKNEEFKAAVEAYSKKVENIIRNEASKFVTGLNQSFQDFKTRCHKSQSVLPNDFRKALKTFNINVSKLKECEFEDRSVWLMISAHAYALIVSCGKIMLDSNENKSQNINKVWQLIKKYDIEINTSHYNALIKVMNDSSIEFNPETIFAELKEKNLEPDPATYQRCILQYCKQKKLDLANNLLEEMKSKGFILNENIFAALIVGYSPNVDDIFKLMETAMIEPTITTYSAAFSALLDDFEKNPDLADKVEKISKKLDLNNAVFRDIDINELLIKMRKIRDNYEFIDKIFNDMLSSISSYNITTSRLIAQLFIAGDYETASSIFWNKYQSSSQENKKTSAVHYLSNMCFCQNMPPEFIKTQINKVKELYPQIDIDGIIFSRSAEFKNKNIFKFIIKEFETNGRIRIEYYWPLITFESGKEEKFQVLIDNFAHISNEPILIEVLQRFIWPSFLDNPDELFELNIKKGGRIPSSIIFRTLLQLYFINFNSKQPIIKFLNGLTREKILSYRTEDYPFQSELANQVVASRVTKISKDICDPNVTKLVCEMCGIHNLS